MSNIATIDYSVPAAVKAAGKNYRVQVGGKTLTLVRDVDFGVIPNTKRPSLLKGGCERLVMSAGLTQVFTVESSIENYENGTPFFFYRVRCDLFAWIDGQQKLITSGYGSANTNERQNGKASPFDSANRCIKMARKRALSDACLTVFQLSNAFTQDMETLENDGSLDEKIDVTKDDDIISAKQLKRLFTIAGRNGVSVEDAQKVIADFGYASAKDIKNKDYDCIVDKINEVVK